MGSCNSRLELPSAFVSVAGPFGSFVLRLLASILTALAPSSAPDAAMARSAAPCASNVTHAALPLRASSVSTTAPNLAACRG